MRFPRVVLLAACLLAAAPGLAAEPGSLFGTSGGERDAVPHRFIKVDALDLGLYFGNPMLAATVRVMKVTCILNRFRFGASIADAYSSIDYWDAGMLAPVHVGFTLWSNPKATGPAWGAVPDVYVEAGASMWGLDATELLFGARLVPSDYTGLRVRASLCCDVDYYGLGARLEAGWLYDRDDYVPAPGVSAVYVGFQLRFLTFGIGF